MLRIERLAKTHDRKKFGCGKGSLDSFLKHSARQHASRGLSRTFVLIDDEDRRKILGYFTLTVCEVLPERIPDLRLQRYPHRMPASKLARIAIHSDCQRRGFGSLLLLDAMQRTVAIAENAGLIGLFVDAIDEPAAVYYRKYGFVALESNPLQLFLAMGTIQRTFS